MKSLRKKRIPPSTNKLFPIFIFVATIFMGIGYASVNSIIMNINGEVVAKSQEGVFITNASVIYDDKNEKDDDSVGSINFINGTFMNSVTELSDDGESFITYSITVYNNTNESHVFDGVKYLIGEDTYDNENIVFDELNGLAVGDTISGYESITFEIVFHYKNYSLVEENRLISKLNFSFTNINDITLRKTGADDTYAFWNYRNEIKTITFSNEIDIPNEISDEYKWDVSSSGKGEVMAYITPNINDSTYYDLYIQSDGMLYANPDSSYLFNMFSSVVSIDNLKILDTSNVTNMSYMFYSMSSVTSLDVSNFDTSKVTNMNHMFSGMSSVTSLDVSNFDTSKVTIMMSMFGNMSSATSLDVSNFDTSKVTNMSYMFAEMSSMTSLDVSNFDTSNVTDMSFMFRRMSSMTSLDVNNFDTSKVTNMSYMFAEMSSLTSLDVSNFDTSKVTNMSDMFILLNLTSLDLSNFNTSNVTNMRRMFAWNYSLTSLNISSFDTSNVKDMFAVFYMNHAIESIDISSFNTSNVSDASKMFYLCRNLKTIYVDTEVIFNTDANGDKMFNGCGKLVGGNGTKYNYNSENYETDNIGKSYAVIDTAVYDENGNLLSGTPGFFTLVPSS